MDITLSIDDELIARAKELTGIETDAELFHVALRSLISHEASKRLARLGGSEPDAKYIPRRRFPPRR